MTSTSVHRSKQHIIHDIESVTRQPGFLHTLVFLCCRDLLVDPKEAANRNWRESLSYQAQIANMQKVACPYLDASEKGGGECQSGPSRRVCMRSPGLGRQPNADGQKPDYRTTVLQQKVLHQHDTVGALGSLAARGGSRVPLIGRSTSAQSGTVTDRPYSTSGSFVCLAALPVYPR